MTLLAFLVDICTYLWCFYYLLRLVGNILFKDYQKSGQKDIGRQFYGSVFLALFVKMDKYCNFFSMKKISNVLMNDCNVE